MSRNLAPVERERRSNVRFAFAILSVAILSAGTVAAFYFRARAQAVPLDIESMCPADRPPSAQIVFLIDTTDTYSEIQQAAAKKALRGIKHKIPKHARLSVFAVRASRDGDLESLVSLCNPGSGEDSSRWNSRPEKLKERWKTGFDEPVQKLLDELLKETPSPRSPILSQLQAISVVGFQDEPGKKHLYILSDLLHHDSAYSHYEHRTAPSFDSFKKSGMLDRFAADLEGVSVHIIYVRREGMGNVQGVKHIRFWEQYFDDAGAVVEEVDRLTG